MKLTQDDLWGAAAAQRAGDSGDAGRQQDGGFSLIELLIVILILGILATVVVLAVAGLRANAEDSACPGDFRNLITASEAYFVEYDTTIIPNADGTAGGFEQTLVNVGLARQASEWYDLTAGGDLALPAGSPCTLP